MISELHTYININGMPILRRCENCKNWSCDIKLDDKKIYGYCKATPMYFAYTLQQSVYPITKPYYLCENHKFANEEALEQVSKKVRIADIIEPKKKV
jgi:hypothetical protein